MIVVKRKSVSPVQNPHEAAVRSEPHIRSQTQQQPRAAALAMVYGRPTIAATERLKEERAW